MSPSPSRTSSRPGEKRIVSASLAPSDWPPYSLVMNIVCIAVTLLVGFLFSVSSAFSPQPGFDLTGSVGSSELIVTGHLNEDGTFVTSEIISGNKPTSGEVRLENSVLIAQKLKKELATKSAPEVVLFLNKIPGHSDFYLVPTCLVAFDDAGVPWAWLDDGSMAGNSLGKHPAKTQKKLSGLHANHPGGCSPPQGNYRHAESASTHRTVNWIHTGPSR